MAKRGGFPGGMPGNMNNIMKQAQKMQKQMEETTKALEEKEYEATAGGGVVKVKINGKKEVTEVHLDEEVVDKDDIEMLEDLIMAAMNEAIRMQDEDQKNSMGKITRWIRRRFAVLMDIYGEKVNRLIGELGRLPGIGGKTAQRLAFHIINMPEEQVESLSAAITDAKKNIRYCKSCYTITDQELCPVCASPKRNHKLIMVVETPRDLAAYERVGQYQGVYHVLNGVINPAMGIGTGDIRLKELILRLEQEDVEELIIATNSSVEGEATAMYISKLVKPSGIKVTRIASGVPVGGDLECIDEVTLLRALEGRTLL